MLGLRPSLKNRPSLLDIVRIKNIESLSQSPARLSQLAELHPAEVPLPASPRLTPQRELAVNLPESKPQPAKETPKMAPVSPLLDSLGATGEG